MIFPPIDIPDGTNILELPVKPRASADDGPMLQPVPYSHCNHLFATFEIDMDAQKCRCKKCNEEVSPMFVLQQLMKTESRWMRQREAYQDEMKRLAERSRTKCRHCGEMTEISRA